MKESGSKYIVKDKQPVKIEGANAEKAYYEAITSGERNRVIYGANLQEDHDLTV